MMRYPYPTVHIRSDKFLKLNFRTLFKRVAQRLVNNPKILKKYLSLITWFTGMDIQTRALEQHIEYDRSLFFRSAQKTIYFNKKNHSLNLDLGILQKNI